MKNRFVRAAVGDKTKGGHLSEQNYATYRALAQGGAAAIITGFAVVDPEESVCDIFSFADDSLIPEYKKLTDEIHAAGSKAIAQLAYLSGMAPVRRPLSPSPSKNVYTGIETFGMTTDEISGMTTLFAAAAKRAKLAGFDGAELHAAHGFLHHQFFSPSFNHRHDGYGGTTENRCRFIIETYEAMRSATGDDFSILAKISVDEDFDGCAFLAAALSERGIDAIETSGAWMAHKPKERMYYQDAARKLADMVTCKIIQTGGNRDFPALLDELNSSRVEYFGFARPFISEPDWPRRYFDGELTKLRCLSCNGCTRNGGIRCILDKTR